MSMLEPLTKTTNFMEKEHNGNPRALMLETSKTELSKEMQLILLPRDIDTKEVMLMVFVKVMESYTAELDK